MNRKLSIVLGVVLIGLVPSMVLFLLSLFTDTHAGDYYFEIDPAMIDAVKGNYFSFYNSPLAPLMFPVSIFIRGLLVSGVSNVFSLGAYNDISAMDARYLIGSVGLYVVSAAILLYSLKDRLNSTKALLLFVISICASPMVFSAMFWGHPEEFLMAAAVLSAVVLSINKKYTTSAVILGLALATKQPAWLCIFPILLFIPGEKRVKYILTTATAALLLTTPFLIEGLQPFIHHNFISVSGQDFGSIRGSNLYSLLKMEGLAASGKFIVFFLSILMPITLCILNKKQLPAGIPPVNPSCFKLSINQFIVVLLSVFFLRSVMDVANITYYALPAALILYMFDYYYEFDNKKVGHIASIKNWFIKETDFPRIAYSGGLFIAVLLLGFSELISTPKTLISILVGVPSLILIFSIIKTLYGPYREDIKPVHIALVLSLLLFITIPSAWYKLNEKPTYTSPGMKNVPIERIRTGFQGRHAAWLGEETPLLGGQKYYLEQHSMKAEIFIFGKYVKRDTSPLSILYTMDYGAEEDPVKIISIMSSYKVTDKSRAMYNNCVYRGRCKLATINWKTVRTPLGTGMYAKAGNAWQVKIIHKGQMIYIMNDNAPVSMSEALPKLKMLK